MKATARTLLDYPLVKEWHSEVSRQRTSTADLYLQSLWTYWSKSIKSRGFKDIGQYVQEVREQQKSDDTKVRRRWATDLLSFMDGYTSPRTGRSLTTQTRNVFVAALKSFLILHLGDITEPSKWILSSADQKRREEQLREEAQPISPEELKRLYNEIRGKRDKAIFLSFLSGFGMAEFQQFAREWHKYYQSVKAKTVPIKVLVKREKTGVAYSCFLWDDAVEALNSLLEEREKNEERDLGPKDPLFINQYQKPVSDEVIDYMIRDIANSSGVEPFDRTKVSYRIRPHELGRDTFKTRAALVKINEDVRNYLIGHKIDPLDYNKFHKDPEGQRMILEEVNKLRPFLNIVTGRGAEPTATARECCRFAELLALQLHITPEEAHNRLLNDLYKNHRDMMEKVDARIKALPMTKQAKLAETLQGHYQHLQFCSHDEVVTLAVDVASQNTNGHKYEIRKVAAEDENAYAEAIADGFEEKGRINGTIIMRRGQNS